MNDSTHSESLGNLPNEGAESLQDVPNRSEANFVPIRKPSERKPSHTLTVREVTRIFEEQDVPITEHTVTNWCKQNSMGICRLDGFYDDLERRWYITPESVELAIKEERTRLRKDVPNPSETAKIFSEDFGNVPNKASEEFRNVQKDSERTFRTEQNDTKSELKNNDEMEDRQGTNNIDTQHVTELEKVLLDMKILNAGKDAVIEELRKVINQHRDDHRTLVDRVAGVSQENGELKAKLLALGEGNSRRGEEHVRDAETGEMLHSWPAKQATEQ